MTSCAGKLKVIRLPPTADYLPPESQEVPGPLSVTYPPSFLFTIIVLVVTAYRVLWRIPLTTVEHVTTPPPVILNAPVFNLSKYPW
jgi:hypothetical protein